MNNPLGVSPSKGKQGTTRGKEKIFWPRWESNPRPTWEYLFSTNSVCRFVGSPVGDCQRTRLYNNIYSHRGQKIFSLPRVVPCFPLLGLTPSGLFMGLSSTIIYTSELILCSTICVPMRPCSSVGRVTVDLIRRSWVRFPPRSKDFFFASCGSLFPFTRANAQWVIHGFKVAL